MRASGICTWSENSAARTLTGGARAWVDMSWGGFGSFLEGAKQVREASPALGARRGREAGSSPDRLRSSRSRWKTGLTQR